MSTTIYTTSTDILVPFHDVDSMQVAWHGHYVKYLEVARCEFLDSIGYSYQAMSDSGYAWPVIDMRIKYIKPLHFGQRVRVQCSLREWEYRLKLEYLISDAQTGERLTKAYTIQVAVDMEKQAMCFESPAILLEKLTQKCGPLPG
jgi:acyl-CoA thioester hydrolase